MGPFGKVKLYLLRGSNVVFPLLLLGSLRACIHLSWVNLCFLGATASSVCWLCPAVNHDEWLRALTLVGLNTPKPELVWHIWSRTLRRASYIMFFYLTGTGSKARCTCAIHGYSLFLGILIWDKVWDFILNKWPGISFIKGRVKHTERWLILYSRPGDSVPTMMLRCIFKVWPKEKAMEIFRFWCVERGISSVSGYRSV